MALPGLLVWRDIEVPEKSAERDQFGVVQALAAEQKYLVIDPRAMNKADVLLVETSQI
jgi:hypothetical protein